MIIKQIMTPKPFTIDLLSGVMKAERIMREKRIGGLPVIDNGTLVGIITSRDIKKAHPNRIVADAMTSDVIVLGPHNTLWEAQSLMDQYNIEKLVIVNNKKVVGILTKSDLFKEIGKYKDSLTGLYKKEYILAKSMTFLKNNSPFSFIFLDLDKFGRIDKDFGHAFGDKILMETSNMLKKFENENTFVCRFGGDEFVLLLNDSRQKATALAVKLIRKFQTKKWPNNLDISASVGIVHTDQQNMTQYNPEKTFWVEELLNKASLASTAAKQAPKKYVVQNL
ncbi:GGDEF domain-containing protein [Petroclostridium sp. X23]|uniref:GGDEF domain-containing protein n=1 Tax=Petroclostridium sp. X23 TaxID=3045146 RepID=UPI0024AE3365|nr:GGDEF domain-containing protein [Petroclostridium sp. X23]WHH59387.1 GGDEF domain-containing protein [Petroclostridium sp. X23]